MYVHDPLGGRAQNSFAVYTKLWYLPTAAGDYNEPLEQWRKRNIQIHERDTLSEATVTLRTVVTFVTWLISRTEFLV